ncbi:twin-arginine translocase TatA/TatE family subunit [Sulfurisphaera tokodaii]|uniref:Sec-independent protein translocase protein TatA n=2 Tax=Sulfurisphaera tokodaii TaxID=111955 RepID=Q974R3_SULTO|nr:twin-arginine translocase TatA/TatE family subunit [Sulfurisphaera tokodaii]BAB65594.1 putative Sec-independent protein translocase protein TatA [Sulfurisphaera tokodaii str. 7]HII74704.1 twin-arginine translocase TatA/TatE family subunit [Sulfurisphaera tokodaii]
MIRMALGSVYDAAIIIVVAIILIFGASKLPEIFRSLGRATGEFKKGKLEAEMELAQLQQVQQQQQTQQQKDLQSKIDELQKQLEELKKQQSQNK